MPLSVSKSKQFNSLKNIKLIEAILNMQPITQNDFQSIMKEKFRQSWYVNAKPGITKAYTAIIRLTDHFIYHTINLADVSDSFIKLHPGVFLFETPLINDKPIAQSNSVLESAMDPKSTATIQEIILNKLKNDTTFRSEFESIVVSNPYFEQNELAESSKMYVQIQENAPYIFNNVYNKELLPHFDYIDVNDAMRHTIALVINLYLLHDSQN